MDEIDLWKSDVWKSDVWKSDVEKSMDGKEGSNMEMTFQPDVLCAMARARDRENVWGRRIFLLLLIGLAGAFAWNLVSVAQLWARVSQGWMLGWTCLLLWRFRRGPQRLTAAENCAGFLRRGFEDKRRGVLEIRRWLFLLVPPLVFSTWGGGGAAIRLARLREWGVNPSSWLYGYASGPWTGIVTAVLLVAVWIAFGLVAKKAERELEELGRRIQ